MSKNKENYSRLEEYNNMSEQELNNSYALLKQWLHKEYEELIADNLMLHINDPIPVDLQDGMVYTIDFNYNIICHGFRVPDGVNPVYFNPTLKSGKVTIIADIIADGIYGTQNMIRAPFCKEISNSFRNLVNKPEALKYIELSTMENYSIQSLFRKLELDSIHLQKLKKIPMGGFNEVKLTKPLYLPECETVGTYAFRFSQIESISLLQARQFWSNAFSHNLKLNELNLGSNVVYLFSRDADVHERQWEDRLWQQKDSNLRRMAEEISRRVQPKLVIPPLMGPTLIMHSLALFRAGVKPKNPLKLIILNERLPEIKIDEYKLLEELYFPNCKEIDKGNIRDCENLKVVALPSCTFLHPDAFEACPQLHDIFLPESMKKLPISGVLKKRGIIVHYA